MGGEHGLIHNEKVALYKLTQIGLKLLKKRLTSSSPIESDRGKIESLIETYQRIRRNQSLGNNFGLETDSSFAHQHPIWIHQLRAWVRLGQRVEPEPSVRKARKTQIRKSGSVSRSREKINT